MHLRGVSATNPSVLFYNSANDSGPQRTYGACTQGSSSLDAYIHRYCLSTL